MRSGTLGIGFIGGHNAMVALYGQGHGHNQKAWDTLYEAVMEMNKVVNEYKEKYNLNYSRSGYSCPKDFRGRFH